MFFDLRAQDLVQRVHPNFKPCSRAQTRWISRVVAIGEKRPFGPLIHGQENVRRRFPKIQKCAILPANVGQSLVSSQILGRNEG